MGCRLVWWCLVAPWSAPGGARLPEAAEPRGPSRQEEAAVVNGGEADARAGGSLWGAGAAASSTGRAMMMRPAGRTNPRGEVINALVLGCFFLMLVLVLVSEYSSLVMHPVGVQFQSSKKS